MDVQKIREAADQIIAESAQLATNLLDVERRLAGLAAEKELLRGRLDEYRIRLAGLQGALSVLQISPQEKESDAS